MNSHSSPNKLRIATWNLNRVSPNGELGKLCLDQITTVQANVWIFTEFRTDFNPGKSFSLVAESKQAADLGENERWTTIWADNSLIQSYEQLNVRDPNRSTCVRITLPNGIDLIVYGTVLPWLGSPWKVYPSTNGEVFSIALQEQVTDWLELQSRYPNATLCVAGDFNQALLNIRYASGSEVGRQALQTALQYTGITCYTGGELDPVNKDNKDLANIDHVCLDGLPEKIGLITSQAWPGTLNGKKVSDHYAVAVDIPFE